MQIGHFIGIGIALAIPKGQITSVLRNSIKDARAIGNEKKTRNY